MQHVYKKARAATGNSGRNLWLSNTDDCIIRNYYVCTRVCARTFNRLVDAQTIEKSVMTSLSNAFMLSSLPVGMQLHHVRFLTSKANPRLDESRSIYLFQLCNQQSVLPGTFLE